jgi:hypothetical protein
MGRDERLTLLIERFRKDLKYKSVKAWPICDKEPGGAIMYHMIHATDHPEAPKFMSRAYRRCVYPFEPVEQFRLELLPETKGASPQGNPPPMENPRTA